MSGWYPKKFSQPNAMAVSENGQYILIAEVYISPKLLLSSDFGATFSATSAKGVEYYGIGASHDFQNIILFGSESGTNFAIYYSHDGAASFSEPVKYFTHYGTGSVACDYNCKYAVVTGPSVGEKGIWYTADYGVTWQLSKSDVLADVISLVVDKTGQYMLAGLASKSFLSLPADQNGIWFSNDYGSSWSLSENRVGAWRSLAAPKNFSTVYALSGSEAWIAEKYYYVLQGTAVVNPTAAPTVPPTFLPTAIPTTAIPTAEPTFLPTAIPTTAIPTAQPTTKTRTKVTLVCNATISGISSLIFDEDYVHGFESAVAESVLDGNTAESHVISVSDEGIHRRQLFAGFQKEQVKLSALSVILTFNVSAIMEETGLVTSSAFAVMYGNMKDALSSGTIESMTNSYVEEKKGGSYTPIVVVSISSSKDQVIYEVIQKPNSHSSHNDTLGTTNIIIIVVVVGGTFLIAFVTILLYASSSGEQVGYTKASSTENAKEIAVSNGPGVDIVANDGSMNI
jgi:hypothetical protein